MGAIFFTAILETIDGEFLENGWASLSNEPNSMDFKNDFVPLLQIGTPVRIVRTLHDKRLHSFRGIVYAASKNFLKITSVSDRELDLIRPTFASNIWFPTQPALYYQSFFPFSYKKADKIDATIYYISETELRYLSMDELDWGQKLVLLMDYPIYFDNTEIEIRQIVEYGGITNCYICDITSISKAALTSIQTYQTQLVTDGETN